MYILGIINLGVGSEYFTEFKKNLVNILDYEWFRGTFEFAYKNIDQQEVFGHCDAIVLSPGDAKVGLLTPDRAQKDPGIPPLYKLIKKAADDGIPLLGVNAGHEAINCAYDWAIDKIPEEQKQEYQKEQSFDLAQLVNPALQPLDPIMSNVGLMKARLTNNYAVLPKEKQKQRPKQEEVIQIAHFLGYPLISKVKSEAPVYGIQFNIQDETKPVFKNFFNLAKKYLRRKQA